PSRSFMFTRWPVLFGSSVDLTSVWGLSPAQFLDLVFWAASITVPGLLFWHGRRQPPSIRRVFSLVAVFAASMGIVHALRVLSADDSSMGLALSFAMVSVGLVAAVALLRRLQPDLAAVERTIRGDDLERLRLLEAAVTASGDGVMIAETSPHDDP